MNDPGMPSTDVPAPVPSPGTFAGGPIPPTRPLWLLLFCLCAAAFLFQAVRLDYTVDDAFTSFRYAKNLVDGYGLTFNPGGPRVEGYTNLLWTLMIAAALRIGLDPVTTARLTGMLCGLAILLLAERLARAAGAGRWSLLAPGLLAVNPAVVTWSSAGLETGLFTALVVMGAILALQPAGPRWSSGAVLAAACLTRPEGLLAAALIVLGVLLAEGKVGLRRLSPSIWPVVLTVVSHHLWRRFYYGAWLPNTFYAKTGDVTAQTIAGTAYVYDALVAFAGGPFFLLLIALAWPRRRAATTVALTFLLGWILYVLLIGGDGLPMHRFIVPALPFFTAIVSSVFARSLDGHEDIAVAAAGVAIVLTLLPGMYGTSHEYLEFDRKEFVPKVTMVGRSLRGIVGPEATIALLPAGAIPYYSGLRTIDMLALNDPIVAHKKMRFVHLTPGHWKYDAAEVLRQKPDYVLLGNVDVTQSPRSDFIPPLFQVEADLLGMEEFRQGYAMVSYQLAEGTWLNCYRRLAAPGAENP